MGGAGFDGIGGAGFAGTGGAGFGLTGGAGFGLTGGAGAWAKQIVAAGIEIAVAVQTQSFARRRSFLVMIPLKVSSPIRRLDFSIM
jgi:hypothetical protein